MKIYSKADLQNIAIQCITDSIDTETLFEFLMNWFGEKSVDPAEWDDFSEEALKELELITGPIFDRYEIIISQSIEDADDIDAIRSQFDDGNKEGF